MARQRAITTLTAGDIQRARDAGIKTELSPGRWQSVPGKKREYINLDTGQTATNRKFRQTRDAISIEQSVKINKRLPRGQRPKVKTRTRYQNGRQHVDYRFRDKPTVEQLNILRARSQGARSFAIVKSGSKTSATHRTRSTVQPRQTKDKTSRSFDWSWLDQYDRMLDIADTDTDYDLGTIEAYTVRVIIEP